LKNFVRLIKLLWTYPARSLGGVIAIVVSDGVQLSVPWITKTVIDQLEAQSLSKVVLLKWGAFLLFLALISYLAKQVWRHLILGAARRIEAQLRQRLLDKTLSLDMNVARTTESGKFMALASSDVPAVGQALAFGMVAFFDSIFITAVAFTLMYQLSPQLTAYALLPFPALALLMLLSLKVIYRRYDQSQQSLEDLTEKTRESLSGIRTLRAYAQAEGDVAAFQEKNLNYRQAMLNYVRVDAVFSPLILLFAGSSSGVLLFFGGRLVISGDLSVGTLAAFIGYLGLLTWPMIAAGWMFVLLQRGSASIARLDEILDSASEKEDQEALPSSSTLQIRRLSFEYPDGSQALKEWDVELEPGKTLGIVGPVGCGKSTFLKLLQRLEEPPSQSIFLDGQDITEYSPASVRAAFSYVSQEPFLFSDTIANNLVMARPHATPAQLSEAVELASLTEDLAQFPDGLQTMLGERGISLSGGQRQRTALARALLKDAPILVLDDTLSAVDTVTEQKILRHLQTQQRDRGQSIVIVTHRLSAVTQADEILVVEQGRIADRGTHLELSSRPGLYLDLMHHQTESGPDQLV
jgi:ATP-binding cassette, subfamily B, multidrug efflux pump